MSAIASLPVEVWQAILRYAIEVPLFLDPDAYEGVLARVEFNGRISLLNHEYIYWSAEKTRNRMQLVSKSWDSFLRPFEHRFVRMLDVRHGKVPLQKLETAIRVSFEGCYDCTCRGVCLKSPFFDFIHETLAQVGSIEAEIFEVPEMAVFLPWTFKLENLKVLISQQLRSSYRLSDLLRGLPSLRHFHGTHYYATATESGQGPFSSNVVTLAFSIQPEGKYDPIVLDLPCLRHLRIDLSAQRATIEFTKEAVLNILRVVGRQLRSFYFLHVPPGNETLEEIWELCPKLESLHISFSLVSPPTGHPIRKLHLRHIGQIDALSPLSAWPNLRRIGLGPLNWREVDFRGKDASALLRDNLRVEEPRKA
jgi:hypothetical protein